MKKETTENIDAALGKLRAKALKAFKSDLFRKFPAPDKVVYGPQGYHLITEGMVNQAVRLAGKNVRALFSNAMPAVLEITSIPEGLLRIHLAAIDHLAELQEEVEQRWEMGLSPGTLKFAIERFDAERSALKGEFDKHRTLFSEPKNPGGHPGKWDWVGAMAHVAAMANKMPDGLPDGPGGQAEIAGMIKDWFVKKNDSHPDDKDVKTRAKVVLDAIKDLARGGN